MPTPASEDGQVLVTLPETPELRGAIARRIPPERVVYAHPGSVGPWADATAWLVGAIDRELPGWTMPLTPRLRFVQRLFTGVDDFPFERFPDSVAIAGNVGAYAPFVAEHALALVLASTHHIVPNWEKVRAGRLRPPLANRYLLNRTVLILGYGAIGREVAARLGPFGAHLEAVTRTGVPDPPLATAYPSERLLDGLARADVVVDCRPLTDATRGTINAEALGRMRPEATYVNVGRAATVDEAALFEHLAAHPGFRAALDVWWDEDYDTGELRTRFPFGSLPNFLGSPHIAGVGGDARARAYEMALENVARFLSGELPRHLIDRSEYSRTR